MGHADHVYALANFYTTKWYKFITILHRPYKLFKYTLFALLANKITTSFNKFVGIKNYMLLGI